MKRVVADGAEEDRVGQRALEVGEPDELVQRLEPVPVEEAVAGRLDDREQDEQGVQRQRREHEQPGDAPCAAGSGGCGSGCRRQSPRDHSVNANGPALCRPIHLLGLRMDYCLAAALMAWATDCGVPVPAYRVATASLIAPPSAGVVAWSRYSWTNFALARPSRTDFIEGR